MATEMNGQFEWSESGKQLLQTIQSYIDQNGGRIALANHIIKDDKKHFNAQLAKHRLSVYVKKEKMAFTQIHDQIMKDNWNKTTLHNLQELLNYRVTNRILNRGKELGLPEWDRNHSRGAMKPKAVIVEFGDYEQKFKSITSAASALGCVHSNVLKAINKNTRAVGVKVRFA